jgi:hypothetical protein
MGLNWGDCWLLCSHCRGLRFVDRGRGPVRPAGDIERSQLGDENLCPLLPIDETGAIGASLRGVVDIGL